MKAIATGKLFGGLVDCYVLEDGRSRISHRGAVAALTNDPSNENVLSRYVGRLPDKYRPKSSLPALEIVIPDGGLAQTLDPEWFVDLLTAYADANDASALHPKQVPLARHANRLLRGLAKVGIVALIHEATGYEEIRAKGALNAYLFRLLNEDPIEWDEMFRPSLVHALCGVYKKHWLGGRHPQWLASVNAKIYDLIIGSAALKALRDLKVGSGIKHHQHLTPEARIAFRRALEHVELIARQSEADPDDFWMRVEHELYGTGLQLRFKEAS